MNETLRSPRLREKICTKCLRLLPCAQYFTLITGSKGNRWSLVCNECKIARTSKILTLLSVALAEPRFWSKVRKTDYCWLWAGGLTSDGYGTFRVTPCVIVNAHIFAKLVELKTISLPQCCLHYCDNRLCVNPTHLFLGDRIDNNADRQAKGRQARGERSGNAKLKADDIPLIRNWTGTQRELAKLLQVSPATIDSVQHRRTWKHIA